MEKEICILGAGMTGLAAGATSGFTVYEAEGFAGGICSSYYMSPGGNKYFDKAAEGGGFYRFENGGGHWIFGGDPAVSRLIKNITPVKFYKRRSAVYLPDQNLLIPYPVQNHLRYFGAKLATRILREITAASKTVYPLTTMAEWLGGNFGPTLNELFFSPFHELYTAGLWKNISPQDPYKSPINLSLVKKGALSDEVPPVGYNAIFLYPTEGLGALAQGMARQCNINYKKRVVRIDVRDKIIYFKDGSSAAYNFLLSTLPLNKMMKMTGLTVDEKADPSTSVLVMNLGAIKSARCPQDHWVYIPKSKAGFHRVGFYSNVDISFLPAPALRRKNKDLVSIYLEKSYPEGRKPNKIEIEKFCNDAVKELQEWNWIKEAEVIDPTWIEVAYTWSWPGSKWKEKSLEILEEHNIYQIGRFARWNFQGIAASIKEGLASGLVFKN